MGSDTHYPEERPAHRVTVDGFWIDRVPLTNERFGAFVEPIFHVYSGHMGNGFSGHYGLPGWSSARPASPYLAPPRPLLDGGLLDYTALWDQRSSSDSRMTIEAAILCCRFWGSSSDDRTRQAHL
jgi:sulfatase modifying factor 1